MEPDELSAWLRLSATPGLGPASARRLLAALGSAQAVLGASDLALQQLLSPVQLMALRTPSPEFDALVLRTRQWLAESAQHRLLTLGDADYPPALLQIEDPPLLLYVDGAAAIADLQPERAIAMVGSRNPTAQGAANARRFAQALAEAGWSIVSGLALGVDGAAHEGALAAASGSLVTAAVVGTGLDVCYPRRHEVLARRIAERGLLLSEFPLGTPPLAFNFPRRNRLIAGLSRATLVVEAALQSGSLITARLASEQGKDVMAIPGSIHAPQSRGCHALIKQGAKLVESVQDLLEEFGATAQLPVPAKATRQRSIQREPALLEALGYDPVGLDALQARTGMEASQLLAQLLTLELDGHVARLPGALFQRQERG